MEKKPSIVSDDSPIDEFEKEVKLRKHKGGYVVWVVKQNEDGVSFGTWERISNFTIECIRLERYRAHGDYRVLREMRITDCAGGTREAFIEPGDMNTIQNFRRWAESTGNYFFFGNWQHLNAVKWSVFQGLEVAEF